MLALTMENKGQSGRVNGIYLVIVSLILFIYLQGVTTLTFRELFIIAYQVYLVLRFINNFGYTICFFDFLLFYSAMDTLIMPLIGYKVYNIDNPLAKLWGWYMRVPADTYFDFLIPANLALYLGLNFFAANFSAIGVKDILDRLPQVAKDKGKIGIVLTIIGFVTTFAEKFAVGSYIFHLLSMLKYVGPLYIYFSDLPFRNKILMISIGAFLAQAIVTGMFGEFVMYLVLVFIVISLKANLKFLPKLLTFIIGLFLISVLQSIKSIYRGITWSGRTVNGISIGNSSKMEVFGKLFLEKVQNPGNLFDERTSFAIYVRMNQGYLISRAMDYVPRVEPFANGSTIVRTLGAVIVPRFLWPDKMESGGHENLARFLGIKKKLHYSMNIGPYGEAYGNFGPIYGVAFIFVYGLFLSFLFKVFLNNCVKRPTLLLWAPLLFYYTLTVETDILSTLNSFIKGSVFVIILFWISNKFFKAPL